MYSWRSIFYLVYIRILKKCFSKRAFLAFYRFNIKTWLKWCTFDAPSDDLSPSPHFLNRFRKQSVEIIFSTSVLAQTVGKGVECYCLNSVQRIQPKGSLLQQAKRTIEKFQFRGVIRGINCEQHLQSHQQNQTFHYQQALSRFAESQHSSLEDSGQLSEWEKNTEQ